MDWAAVEFMLSNDRCNERNVPSDNGKPQSRNLELETRIRKPDRSTFSLRSSERYYKNRP